MTRRCLRLLALGVILLGVAGCTRTVRTPVFEEGRIEIYLRGEKSGGEFIDQGYQHPRTIAPVRLAHILSRVDLRDEKAKGLLGLKREEERASAIDLEALYAIADGLAAALKQASSGEEVVMKYVRRAKSMVIFDRWYLTTFMAYVKDDLLYLHFRHFDWPIPPRREDKLPEPVLTRFPQKFTVLPSKAMVMADKQSVAVEYRDPIFKRPTRTRVTPGGQVIRKTILLDMEVPEEELDDPRAPTPLPAGLSPGALRELADLEEERQEGAITEPEYRSRRRTILEADGVSSYEEGE